MSDNSEESVILEIRGLNKSFGTVHVLDALDLHIPNSKECTVAVLGQNGAGKTTLLNVITRLTSADAGTIKVFGQDILARPAHRLVDCGVSRTFQMPRLMLDETCIDNVMVGALATMSRNRRRLRRATEVSAGALEHLGLLAMARRRVGDLSFGNRKLVELARALSSSPRLLLLDEPAAGLSDAEEKRLIEVLHRLRLDGVSILLIEHRMAVVASVATRVVMLDAGRLIFDGSAEEMLRSDVVRERYLGAGFDQIELEMVIPVARP